MICFLYHIEDNSNLAIDRAFADQVVSMFGHQQVIIQEGGPEFPSTFPMILGSFERARGHALLQPLRWVLLHPQATTCLQDYEHPEDNAIYCVGSDQRGFGVSPGSIDADFVRVAVRRDEESRKEFFAATVLPMVVYDRELKRWLSQRS